MKYALIVILPDWLGWTDSTDPPYINRPEIDPEISPVDYHVAFFRGFLNRDFLRGYTAAHLFGRDVRVTPSAVVDVQQYVIDPVNNEEVNSLWDDSIRLYTREFYERRAEIFGKERVPIQLDAQLPLHPENAVYLDSIARLLSRHETDYRVVMGPTLRKEYPADADIEALRAAFGNRFYDFTRTLSYKADVDSNFYDRVHYRYPLASEMMDMVFAEE